MDRRLIINGAGCFVIGLTLSYMGVDLTSWQFWVIGISVLSIMTNSMID